MFTKKKDSPRNLKNQGKTEKGRARKSKENEARPSNHVPTCGKKAAQRVAYSYSVSPFE